MSRKTKYDPTTFPVIAEQAARNGMTDEEISELLNIHPATLYRYQDKYSEFSEAIKRGKVPANLEVEAAAFKRAIGFEWEEEMIETERNPKTGRMVTTKRRVTKKFTPPDTAAFIYFLNNRSPDRWQSVNKVEHRTNVKSIYEIVKQMAEEAEILEIEDGLGDNDQ